ncbi:hypothetical protein FA13DRAFT_1778091 [Coprinellus micaceus]|uniref:Uncharacterized protein n=1 Tax=Coprinellus micaceus TaxID=71717 RepID=A0A4Y7SPP9_COPMI|nr:hypothetical protein FA13DRAFT_1778091 [Coprinellus micaceus]
MPRTPSQSEERRKAHRKRLSLGTGVGKVEQSIRRFSKRNVNGELRVPRVEVVGLAERSVNGISKTNEDDSVPTGDCLGGRPGSDQPSTGLASQDPVLELQSIFQETFGRTPTNHKVRQCAITPFPLRGDRVGREWGMRVSELQRAAELRLRQERRGGRGVVERRTWNSDLCKNPSGIRDGWGQKRAGAHRRERKYAGNRSARTGYTIPRVRGPTPSAPSQARTAQAAVFAIVVDSRLME